MSVLTHEESLKHKKPAEKAKIVKVVIEIPDTEKKPPKKEAPKAEEKKEAPETKEAPKAEPKKSKKKAE